MTAVGTLVKGVTHVLGGTEGKHISLRHSERAQCKTDTGFISGIFHFIFLGPGGPQVTEPAVSESVGGERQDCNCISILRRETTARTVDARHGGPVHSQSRVKCRSALQEPGPQSWRRGTLPGSECHRNHRLTV